MEMKINCRSALKAVLFVGVLALTGCVSIPSSIQGGSADPAVSLESVQNAPEMYIGQEGRFGGKVISVFNEPNKTRLEIAVMPLSKYDAAPELNTASTGRIYAYVNRFLEPVDFKGRYVTVVGTISGEQIGKIGEIPYKYITLNVTGYQRWNLTQSVVLPPAGPWGYGYYNDPYYHNWGYGYGYGYPGGVAPVQTYLTE
ncbi:Slp family lipoprotein [Providencia burhodogranariea]|uniref:Outer membrane lipoprotein n=1 Tax=Providencia burhodogranariea DSM 19968 TaxID=1141662 RepID=K8WRY7_9GAMM|nr:Slp family lipoprotein [Providencia burhodogranariea]EKT62731.1 hypothetical protein OOA_06466 [Providencia burhodogranariea DSM 19968]